MEKKPTLEARLLYSMPPEPDKRLRRLLFLGFVGSAIFFLFCGGALSSLTRQGLFQWSIGVLLLILASINWISSPLWVDRITTPGIFYLVNGYIRLPLYMIMLAWGISINALILPSTSTRWINLGLMVGLLFMPFVIMRKLKWIEESLEEGHLKKCLNKQTWTWDPAHDMDHIRKDPKKMRPGFFWRMLFWIGPAIGMSLADIFGRLNALLITSLLGVMLGYLVLISIISDSISLSLVLFGLEKERGQRIKIDQNT